LSKKLDKGFKMVYHFLKLHGIKTVKRSSSFLEIFRELLDGVKQHWIDYELALELRVEDE
jgi:hypothetical protein